MDVLYDSASLYFPILYLSRDAYMYQHSISILKGFLRSTVAVVSNTPHDWMDEWRLRWFSVSQFSG